MPSAKIKLSTASIAYAAQQIAMGVSQPKIAHSLGVEKSVVTNIAKCLNRGYPPEDYQLISSKNYINRPINESGQFIRENPTQGSWDVRMGLNLLRVPFAKWPQALDASA